MKKKILIVTYHDGINYGAFLQVYSLQEFLINNNYDVEILNYKSLKHTIFEYYFLLKTKNFNLLINTISKIFKFKSLQKKLLFTTKRIFKLSSKNNLNYDYIIYGSDEIWNFQNTLIGLDLTYFGENIKGNKISYAPSFGNIDSSRILPQKVIELLKKFTISVRDINSYDIISKNIEVKPHIVLDPTFLIKNHLKEYKSKINIPDKYILLYMTQQLPVSRWDEIIDYAIKHDTKVISVGYKHNLADINLINTDPVDFMKLIRNAEIILTNMFHGFILSIQNEKKVHLFYDEYRKNKLGFYLEYFNLKYLIIEVNESLVENLDNKNIDYNIVNQFIEKKLEDSKQFLVKNLI